MYCASDSGLGRGFTVYEDYIFPELTALKTAVLVDRALMGMHGLAYFLEDWLESARLQPLCATPLAVVRQRSQGSGGGQSRVPRLAVAAGAAGAAVLRLLELLRRPLPLSTAAGKAAPFRGRARPTPASTHLIQYWWDLDKTRLPPEDLAFAADAYDDCIADLDEQLGSLFDELRARGVLERTWLIITSDHGESFGEHAGVFCHGSSLYQTELHVPLLDHSPGGNATPSRSSRKR